MTLPNDPAGNPLTPPATPPVPPAGTPPPATGEIPPSNPPGTPPPSNSDWEARYKGLQSSSDRKISDLQAQLVALQVSYSALNTQHEDLKHRFTEATAAKTGLETTQATLQGQLTQVTQEKEALLKKQNQQSLLLRTYPQIAPFIQFIPPAETDEVYLENAKAFASTLQGFVDLGVKGTLSGGTPPTPPGTPPSRQQDRGDELYNKAVSLAGVRGKEVEYAQAQKEYETYLIQQ